MTATQVQLRRDTATNIDAATPAAGEPAWDTTNARLRMGDGVTQGGIILPNAADVQKQSFSAATATGTANALTLAITPVPASWATFLSFDFIPASNNTGSATVAITGLTGTKTFKKKSAAGLVDLEADDLVADQVYRGVYNGTYVVVDALHASAGILSVSQGDLNTSTGSVSYAYGNNDTEYGSSVLTLPGGEFGLGMANKTSVSGRDADFIFCNPASGTSYVSCGRFVKQLNTLYYDGSGKNIAYTANSDKSFTAYVQQRYIAASPPFDLGDGEVGGFIFALVNPQGEIVSHYAADVPPWGYNGPTSLAPCRQCPVTKKKYRRVMRARSFEEIMDGAALVYDEQEITQAVKNADMALIPHPFGAVPPGHSVVLLDPMDERIRAAIDYQNAGGDFVDEITAGKIRVDNATLSRKGPPGVGVHRMVYQYSGKGRGNPPS
jgi:hypothetical protein